MGYKISPAAMISVLKTVLSNKLVVAYDKKFSIIAPGASLSS